jgi:hypothetical protein
MNASGRKNLESLSIGILLGVILAWASNGFGLTWDETIYFKYSDTIRDWFLNHRSFEPSVLRAYWNYSSYHNPHPPFMKILNAFSSAVFSGLLPFPTSYRMANIVFVSSCAALTWRLLRTSFSGLMVTAAICFICLQPRVFGHLMIAATDSPVAMAWLVLTLIAWRLDRTSVTVHRPILRLLLFTFLAMAGATKITGFMAVIPLAAYFLFQKNFRELRWLAAAALFGLVVIPLISPNEWTHPLSAIGDFLLYPFLRSKQAISTFYLGRIYKFYLPWHYFLVMTAVTYPVILLFLLSGLVNIRKVACHGLIRAILFPVGFWLILAHVPTTPKHDGIRQLLSIYPLIGLLSWFGLMGWLEAIKQAPPSRGRSLLQIFSIPVILCILAFGVFRCHPFELSYYNCLIGGIRGAEKKGFELTYYLEAITPEFLNRLNPYLDNGKTVYLMPPWPLLLRQYAEHGVLTGNFSQPALGTETTIDYLLILRRRGYVSDALYKAVTPLEEVTYNGVSLVKFYESPNSKK